MTDRLSFFAPCPKGVEPLLAEELRALGLRGVRPQRSGVLFSGRAADAQRAVYWSRLASRVLLTLADVAAGDADTLYAEVKKLPWESHVRQDGTVAVDAAGTNAALRNTQFTAVRVKDAIADRFREATGVRPGVDTRRPDLRVNVLVRGDRATVSVDVAGEPLHRRGYRAPGVQVEAPLKENLAAAVLAWSEWPAIAEREGAFIDPLCGSGTLAIEAALMAGVVAPGLIRAEHAVQRWLGFDQSAWERMVKDAEERRREGLERLPLILASDADERAVEIAQECVRRAGLEYLVHIEHRGVTEISRPEDQAFGLIATNPPWGQRIGDAGDLQALYARMSERIKTQFGGWGLTVVTPDPALSRGMGMHAIDSTTLGSGKGEVVVTRLETGVGQPGKQRAGTASTTTAASSAAEVVPVSPEATEFENRLAKMAKHYGKWARRTGTTCYRVYDADLPNFALAVDVYKGAGPDIGQRWLHVAEYAPPAEVSVERAGARLEEAVVVIARVFGVDTSAIFVKRRERQRGASQYERHGRQGATGVVAENGLLFEVNLSDFLDTGLFLDHRDTRAWIRELATGARFLNLFAYTGAVTVYAAAGGAAETTTVDMSATYLEWARRNLELNALDKPQHHRVQQDVLAWVREATRVKERFDLIFCDPPTFSASKRMVATFDVQRDHVDLIGRLGRVLERDGTLIFSTNRRGFELDSEALRQARLEVRDVTARTIPKDFERTPGVHRCWTIQHA